MLAWMLALAALAGPQCVEIEGGRGCMESLRGWRVLDLHGTDEAIGAAYGALLREELLGEWVPMNERMHYEAMPAVFRMLFRRHQRHFPDYFDDRARDRARGLEGALGLKTGTVHRYAWLADLASIGPSLQLALAGTVQVDPVTGSVGDRCTSVVGRDGEATVHARNLDFWGMGYWQRLATLSFVEPLTEDGQPDGLRYAQVGTVGEVFAGSSGVNEAGLAVTSHLHVTRDSALAFGRLRMKPLALLWEGLTGRHPRGGTSIYVLFERLLRDATDVEAAIAILRQRRPVGAWSFVLSDPSGDRAVVGTNPRDLHVSRSASVNTNFYLDEAMHRRELHPARGPLEGTRQRYARAEALLGDGTLTPERATALLRDRFDAAAGAERAVSANTVLSPDTSQSVVFVTRPSGDHTLWLADPHADGYTPAPLAPFAAWSFRDGFAPGRHVEEVLAYEEGPLDALTAAYVDAMRLVLDANDRVRAAAALRALGTDDPGIRLMAAWSSAAVGETTQAREQLDQVDRARASAHHQALAGWLDGELLARAGDTARAERAWREALLILADDDGRCELMDEPLRAVLEDRLAGGWQQTELPFPDLKFQDVLELRLGR